MTRWPDATLSPSGTAIAADGVDVAYYDFGGTGPALLLAHATGFCAAVFAPLAAVLSSRFRCVALDERGHGASGRPANGDFSWGGFGDDVLAVVDALSLEHPIGFGHSCGGAALLLAEQARPGTFAGLYCYEPVVYPGDVPPAPELAHNPLSARALRRRPHFASRGEALKNFSSKAPLDVLDPAVLAAYVDNGFEPDADPGAIRLRCRPEDEAAIYSMGMAHSAFAHLGAMKCPVTLASGARTDAMGAGALALLAARLAHCEEIEFAHLGHFGPLEDPVTLARSLEGSKAALG